MKKVNLNLNLYSFDELSEDAKDKARINHIEFLGEVSDCYFNDKGNVKPEYENYFVVNVIQEMERMQTPWFFSETMYHEHKSEIDEEIKANDYLFFEDGEMANCISYVKNNKVYKTEFNYNSQTIEI
jgi:hypothetical protein